MKKWMIIIVLALALFAGCTEEQMQQADEVANTVEAVTEGGEAVLNSPAGFLIPPQYQAILRLGGEIAMLLVLGWREFRNRQAQKAVKEIVAGIELAKPSLDENAKKALGSALSTKESVGTETIVKSVK